MFIEQAFKYLHDSWRYLLGFLVIFIIWQLGSIPFVLAIVVKIILDGGDLSLLEDQSKLMSILDPNVTLFLVLLSFAIGLAGLYLWLRFIHKQTMTSLTTSRKQVDWERIMFGFLLIAGTTTVLTLLDYYSDPDGYVVQFQWLPFLGLFLISMVMMPLQTSFEEYLFRGYLMQGIGIMAGNRWMPLIITSVIFGGLHFFNPEVGKLGNVIMIYYIGTGLFLGVITLMDEGMELSLGFHAGNNLIASLLVTADWTAFQTNSILRDVSDPSAGIDVIVPVLFVYPVFLGLMSWRYNWSGWNEKLFGKVEKPPEPILDEIEI
jgi:membrane protease YdiL (CAAX protease family)